MAACLMASGCIQNALKAKDPAERAGRESGLDSETALHSGGSGDTSFEPPGCPEGPPDVAVPVTGCPFDGELNLRWTGALGENGTVMQLGAGPATSDPGGAMSIWVAEGVARLAAFAADGALLSEQLDDNHRVNGSVADLDEEHLGAEYFASYYERDAGVEHLGLLTATSVIWQVDVPEGTSNEPWLADLYGDGRVEALVGGSIYDARTGLMLARLDGVTDSDASSTIAADLNGDGIDEIIGADSATPTNVKLFQADGSVQATCYTAPSRSEQVMFGVGNLDEDAEGEWVAAGDGFVVVCDSDGTLISASDLGVFRPGLVGIGDLDGDGEPEVVVSGEDGMVVTDRDLVPRWSYGGEWGWYPFSLADLNRDGAHEVLVSHRDSLLVFDGNSGVVVASASVRSGSTNEAWHDQPIVVDIDGDGSAEIIVGDRELFCFEDGTGTGWHVDGADMPWPGRDHFPGDRTVSGGIGAPAQPWNVPGENVWQGLPAYGSNPKSELGVQIVDVCVESCDGDAVVTVQVSNSGRAAATEIDVYLTRTDTGEQLGVNRLAGLASGVATFTTFTTSANAVQRGLKAVLVQPNGGTECGTVANEDTWDDATCP